VSRDLRPDVHDGQSSFLDSLYPAGSEDVELTPRSVGRHAVTTSEAFGSREVGPPVSRLAEPEPVVEKLVEPAPVAVRPERCPSCGARVRAEQDWCSLCHASVLPTPEPEPEPVVRAVPVAAPVAASVAASVTGRVREDEDGQLALDFETPAGPAPELSPELDEAEVSRMLGVLAATSTSAPRGLGSRQAKIAVAVGGGLGLTALLLGGMTALGSVLG